MLRYIFLCLGIHLASLAAFAQTPLPPRAHGGDLSKTLDLRNPANSTLKKELEYDYEKQNPRYRSLLPKVRKCVTVEMEQNVDAKNPSEAEPRSRF